MAFLPWLKPNRTKKGKTAKGEEKQKLSKTYKEKSEEMHFW